jgi:hypothetical protein
MIPTNCTTKPPKTTNDSIAEQVAIKGIIELMVAKEEVPKDLRYAVWWWMRDSLKSYCGVQMGGKVVNPIEEIEK